MASWTKEKAQALNLLGDCSMIAGASIVSTITDASPDAKGFTCVCPVPRVRPWAQPGRSPAAQTNPWAPRASAVCRRTALAASPVTAGR